MPALSASRTQMRARVVEAVCVALSIGFLVWPMLAPGDLLGRDLVFVPDQPLDLQALGLDSSARAVPLDVLVSLVQAVLGSWLTSRLALVIPLVLAAYGARRLLGRASLPGRIVVMSFAVVNPYVVERLAIGHWALLWAYAALPWIVHLLARSRISVRGALLACAAASITPTGGVIATVVGIGVLFAVPAAWRQRSAYAAGAVVLQLPWIVAGFVGGGTTSSDPAGAVVFAANGAAPGGPIVSLLSFGGIWNAEVVPPTRTGPMAVVAALLVVGVLVAGARWLTARLAGPGAHSRGAYRALAGCAALGFALAVLPAFGAGQSLVEWLIEVVPGAGLLRDSQKWLMPFVLLSVVSLGAVVARWTTVTGRGWQHWSTVLGALVLPVVLLPDPHAVLRPTLTPVTYSSEWPEVAALVDNDDVTVVVPWSAYRAFEWASGRSVLDPAGRVLDGVVLTNDDLVVGDITVQGESRLAAEVGAALGADDPAQELAALGVSHVLIEHQTPGALPEGLQSLTAAYDGEQLTLLEIENPAERSGPTAATITAAVVSHGAFLLLAIGLLVSSAVRPVRAKFAKSGRTTR